MKIPNTLDKFNTKCVNLASILGHYYYIGRFEIFRSEFSYKTVGR